MLWCYPMLKSDKFATSTVLTEACALMSVILVCYLRDVVSAVLLCYGNVAGWLDVTRRHCIKTAKPI